MIMSWDDIKLNPPKKLKVSPIYMIPHKSQDFRSILDLSFCLRIAGFKIPSVNETTGNTAPKHFLSQFRSVLPHIIGAILETEDKNTPIFFRKIDIKERFWRLVCQSGEEWNLAYVFPDVVGEPTRLVIPTSLQMVWVKSPAYFYAATETARDVAMSYIQ